MKKQLLFEIGLEEMPSAYMPRAINELKNLAEQKLSQSRIPYEKVLVYGTPRRLVLLAEGIGGRQLDAVVEHKGPKKSIAIDDQGHPTKAGLGFARGQGIDFSGVVTKEVGGIEYIFAIKKEKGKPTKNVIPGVLASLIYSLTFPKSMRWGYNQIRFARPIRWITAWLGNELIDLEIDGIKSRNITYGHRFLSPGRIKITGIKSYFQSLENNYVILDQEKRQELIWQQVQKAAVDSGGRVMENPDLLEEVNYLLEYPTAFYGQFSPSYLEVPPEVLITTMIKNQRYFPVFDEEGHLRPGFIGVRNGTNDNLDIVRAGNERVLKARLEDALFFWKEDTKKTLEEMAAGLKNILFHERLGNMMEKVERLQKLGIYISNKGNISNRADVVRGAYLCKADLCSSMVYEFPELQGVMGRYYALKSGEGQEVSNAVFEHYLPRFAGDMLPSTKTGLVLSLADKIDTLVGSFAINIKPTGSQDPYALRRQGIGIVSMLIDAGVRIDLKEVLMQAYQGYKPFRLDNSSEQTTSEVLEFILQRMRGLLTERGLSYDVIDAVMATPHIDLNNTAQRIKAVQEFRLSENFSHFMVVYNRANNLTKNWENDTVRADDLVDDSEKELYRTVRSIYPVVEKALQQEDYPKALNTIAGIRYQVDRFFESVMVMVDNQELRAARLGLLKSIANLCNTIACFERIVE
ncbi:MAG: glycine--tRNA ligase subunit beta [Syntrophomonadaceae bacterium]|jgi:glycyl-tRNA synthetase beta chain